MSYGVYVSSYFYVECDEDTYNRVDSAIQDKFTGDWFNWYVSYSPTENKMNIELQDSEVGRHYEEELEDIYKLIKDTTDLEIEGYMLAELDGPSETSRGEFVNGRLEWHNCSWLLELPVTIANDIKDKARNKYPEYFRSKPWL